MTMFNVLEKTKKDKDDDEEDDTIKNYWNAKSLEEKSKKKKKTTVTTSTCWNVGEETIEKCPHAEVQRRVIITRSTKHKIQAMMETMGSDEWLGLLIGKEIEDEDNWIVNDLFIPEQEVTSASATKKKHEEPDNVVGIIHSHHDMGTFWSGTDMKHANSNFDLSIVVDSDLNALGTARQKTSCGKLMRQEVEIEFVDDYLEELEWSKKQKEDKIKKKYTYSYTNSKWGLNRFTSGRKKVKKPKKDDDDKKREGTDSVVLVNPNDSDRTDERNIFDITKYKIDDESLRVLADKEGIPLIGSPDELKIMDFDDWLSINHERAFKNWGNLKNYERKQKLYKYIQEVYDETKSDVMELDIKYEVKTEKDDNDKIPEFNAYDRDGEPHSFRKWLDENRPNHKSQWNELTDLEKDKLQNDFFNDIWGINDYEYEEDDDDEHDINFYIPTLRRSDGVYFNDWLETEHESKHNNFRNLKDDVVDKLINDFYNEVE